MKWLMLVPAGKQKGKPHALSISLYWAGWGTHRAYSVLPRRPGLETSFLNISLYSLYAPHFMYSFFLLSEVSAPYPVIQVLNEEAELWNDWPKATGLNYEDSGWQWKNRSLARLACIWGQNNIRINNGFIWTLRLIFFSFIKYICPVLPILAVIP